MEKSTMLDEDSLKRILLGAVIGAAITVLVGFSGFGWMLEGTAKEMAKKSAEAAVAEALAPICADKVRASNSPAVAEACGKVISAPK